MALSIVKTGDWLGMPHDWVGVSNGMRIVALCEDVADAEAIIARRAAADRAALPPPPLRAAASRR
jgi:hypothetical protein